MQGPLSREPDYSTASWPCCGTGASISEEQSEWVLQKAKTKTRQRKEYYRTASSDISPSVHATGPDSGTELPQNRAVTFKVNIEDTLVHTIT